jgi:peptidoglycan/xylan/chitin deacetylase (PgdA/CDA1 family)
VPHAFLIDNIQNLLRDLRRENPAAIPGRLAGIASRKAARLTEEIIHRTGMDAVIARNYCGKGIVMMFHEIHTDVDAELRTGCDPAQLERVVLALRARGRDIVDIDEGLRRLADPGSKPFAILTFDDGYRDNLTVALPVLERLGAPMTVFVPTGMVTREVYAWWLGLRRWILDSEAIDVLPMGRRFDCADLASKLAAKRQITAWIGDDQSRADSLAPIFAKRGISLPELVEHYAVNEAELRTMARHPLVTIGAHTATHRFLTSLGEADVFGEFSSNKAFLEAVLDRPVDFLAYPYGTPGACGEREGAQAAKAGLRASFTTRHGHLYPEHLGHTQLLPRIDVGYAPQSDAALAARLSGLQRAMSTRFGDPIATIV